VTDRLAPACAPLAGAGLGALALLAAAAVAPRIAAAHEGHSAAAESAAAARSAMRSETVRLPVPVIAQSPERCGPAALAMVLRYYGAPDSAVAGADRAYSPELKGALITDLARAAERAGFAARVAALTEDSLLVVVRDSIPPILYFWAGAGPLTRGHYGVLVGFDLARLEYAVNDGGERTAHYSRKELMRRWRAAGSLALLVRRRTP
jgi:ABC-type bacteriocin/lantibiotic exporter with double-glycine peptidase domain